MMLLYYIISKKERQSRQTKFNQVSDTYVLYMWNVFLYNQFPQFWMLGLFIVIPVFVVTHRYIVVAIDCLKRCCLYEEYCQCWIELLASVQGRSWKCLKIIRLEDQFLLYIIKFSLLYVGKAVFNQFVIDRLNAPYINITRTVL